MNPQLLEAGYLVIGSGAIGMAFADVILNESDASIVMVDRHAAPAGTGMMLTPLCACTRRPRGMASIPGNWDMAPKT